MSACVCLQLPNIMRETGQVSLGSTHHGALDSSGVIPTEYLSHYFFQLCFIYLCACICMCGGTFAMAHAWTSEDNLQALVLSYNHMGPRDQIQVPQTWQHAFLPAEPSCHL